jgi:hypothetical protein
LLVYISRLLVFLIHKLCWFLTDVKNRKEFNWKFP